MVVVLLLLLQVCLLKALVYCGIRQWSNKLYINTVSVTHIDAFRDIICWVKCKVLKFALKCISNRSSHKNRWKSVEVVVLRKNAHKNKKIGKITFAQSFTLMIFVDGFYTTFCTGSCKWICKYIFAYSFTLTIFVGGFRTFLCTGTCQQFSWLSDLVSLHWWILDGNHLVMGELIFVAVRR